MKVGLIITFIPCMDNWHYSWQMESTVTAPVSGHVKRVVVQEGM